MKSAAVSTKASNLCQLFYVFIFNEDASNVGRVPRSKKGPKYISSTYFQANCLSDSVPVIPVFYHRSHVLSADVQAQDMIGAPDVDSASDLKHILQVLRLRTQVAKKGFW